MTAPNPSAGTQRSAVEALFGAVRAADRCNYRCDRKLGHSGPHIFPWPAVARAASQRSAVEAGRQIHAALDQLIACIRQDCQHFDAAECIRELPHSLTEYRHGSDALAASAPPSLDVERLARAMEKVRNSRESYIGDHGHGLQRTWRKVPFDAEHIARAYSEASAEPKDGGE